MREEISNELLLAVLQAWDPSEAHRWTLDNDGDLCNATPDVIRYIRTGPNRYCGQAPHEIYGSAEGLDWHEAVTLVEFLLKDRPDLELLGTDMCWKAEVPAWECEKATGAVWNSDPWKKGPEGSESIVIRIKAYEFLREWKEKQGKPAVALFSDTSCGTASQAELERTTMKIETPSVAGAAMVFMPNGPKTISNFTGGEPKQILCICTGYPLSILNGSKIKLSSPVPFDMKPGEVLRLVHCEGVWWETSRTTNIDSSDVTLSIDGQTIEGMEICDDVLEVPATYAPICAWCNGSKEVTGWGGKESCRACS